MNAKQRSALANNRSFLSKNIIWTSEFASRLVEDGLITEYMLQDIQQHDDRDSTIQALLDVLPLKGGKTFESFCDVLQMSGHFFLADFLRDEVNRNEVTSLRDISKRLPFLQKLRDFEKKKLESYIGDMVKEEMVKRAWKKDFDEKDKTLAIKEKQIVQSFKHDEDKKQHESTIGDLHQKLKDALEEISLLKIQTTALKESAVETETRHKEQLNRQIKFNMANDSSLRRVQDRIENQQKTLDTIRIKLNSVKGMENKTLDTDDIGVSVSGTGSLIADLDLILQRLRHLADVEKKYESLQEERDWIIMHLGADSNGTSLVQAYKRFAVQNEEHLHTLKEEVTKYSELVKEQEATSATEKTGNAVNVWQQALMGVLKRQVQDLKTSSRQKDKKIGMLENEINCLKSTLAENDRKATTVSASIDTDHTDNTLQASGEQPLQSIATLHPEQSRSYKNSFLPPLPSGSPVEGPSLSSRRAKASQAPSLSSLNRSFNPRSHHLSSSAVIPTQRADPKVRYGPPYHTVSQGIGSANSHSKQDFQLVQKAIIGKKIQ